MKIEIGRAGVGSRSLGMGGLVLALGAVALGCEGGSLVGDAPSGRIAVTSAPSSGLAVLGGDFTSSVVSLLASDGTLAKDDCLDSGTATGNKLSFALSGDVALPSQPQSGGKLWIVDRGNAALTILEPTTCAPVGQFSVATGFKSNPHDVVVLSDTKAYVTRYDKSVAPTSPLATGDDVIILDPKTGALTGRIDLAEQATPLAGFAIQARPDRMVLSGGKVYVSLNNQDAKVPFTASEGAVVVIDPVTDAVIAKVALTGLKGCEAMSVLDDAKRLFVACGGSFSEADQAAASGIAEIDLGTSPPTLVGTTKAAALGGGAVNFSWVGAPSATRLLVATMGSFGNPMTKAPDTKDALFSIDLTTGKGTALGIEGAAFDFGGAAVGASTLFLPDASSVANKPALRVFELPDAGPPQPKVSFDPDPAKKLAPRQIAWY
jgi:hypothetical protein